MREAVVFGLLASSGLVLGAAIAAFWRPRERVLAVLLAFASGSLIAALAVELFGDAFDYGGVLRAGLGLLVGAAVFVAVDTFLDRRIARAGKDATGLALLAAATLDGVPENLAMGVSLAADGGLVLLAAIFVSNFPEALAGTADMREGGRSRRLALTTWLLAALLLAATVVVGRAALGEATKESLSFLLAFAGGAVVASIADTLMPKAYEQGGPWVALATAVGFFLSYSLSAV